MLSPDEFNIKKGYITSAIINSRSIDDRIFCLSYLGSMAIMLSILEIAIPKPLPWMKIGLANSVTLYAFGVLKIKEVFVVVLARVLAVSIIIGTFLSTTFVLSLTGAVTSFIVMAVAYRYLKRFISLIGISVLGASASNLSQLMVVNWLFLNSRVSYYLFPILLAVALIGGIITGLFAMFLRRNI